MCAAILMLSRLIDTASTMAPHAKKNPERKPSPPAKRTDDGRKAARAPYHHGNLRRALLVAGEAELAEKGVEGFTLRGCARRAGVSHAAPAHHFKDARALLTALSTEGFRRLTAAMRNRQRKAAKTPRAQFVAAGLGYLDFALASPASFRLMFASDAPDTEDEERKAAGDESYAVLLDAIRDLRGRDPRDHSELMADVAAAWSVVHGLSHLLLAGRLPFLDGLHGPERDAMFERIIAGAIA